LRHSGIIQDHLVFHSDSTSSKYETLATDRLLALAESKLQGLLQASWSGREGHQALDFLIELAGLKETDADYRVPTNTYSPAVGPDAHSIIRDLKVDYLRKYLDLIKLIC
jgi:hypothetical protein